MENVRSLKVCENDTIRILLWKHNYYYVGTHQITYPLRSPNRYLLIIRCNKFYLEHILKLNIKIIKKNTQKNYNYISECLSASWGQNMWVSGWCLNEWYVCVRVVSEWYEGVWMMHGWRRVCDEWLCLSSDKGLTRWWLGWGGLGRWRWNREVRRLWWWWYCLVCKRYERTDKKKSKQTEGNPAPIPPPAHLTSYPCLPRPLTHNTWRISESQTERTTRTHSDKTLGK